MLEPKLYIIATPIGNRDDISKRALDCFRSLNIFFAEDSREFIKLLELYQIPAAGKKIYSYAAHNLKTATSKALTLLKEGKSIGVVSDRGTPGISDPGALLVEEARGEGYSAIPIPGPSSVIALMSVSGFNADRFVFLGFLPTSAGSLDSLWKSVESLPFPICFFESPKRIRSTMENLKVRFSDRRIFLGRELTKMFESFYSDTLQALDSDQLPEKGEYVVALAGAPGKSARATEPWEREVELRLANDREWAKQMARRFGGSASDFYNALQRKKKDYAST